MLNDSNIDGYFRAGVGACLTDNNGCILIMRRVDVPEAWQMPQGGINEAETPEQALVREVAEETGINGQDFQIKATTGWLSYELPRSTWNNKTGRGQTQKWFLCRVNEGVDVKPDHHEFDCYRWVSPAEVIELAAGFRKDLYVTVLETFSL